MIILLTPCSSCARHVRSTELACPFCGAAIAPSIATSEPRVVNERLTRSALHALGVAVGTATIVSVAIAAGGCIMATPAYGAPDAGTDTNGDAR